MDEHRRGLNRGPERRLRPHVPRRSSDLPRWFVAALAVVPVAGLAVFYLWPLGTLLARTVGDSGATDTLLRRRTWDVLWFTTWQAAVSTALTVVLGLAPAHVIARYRFRGRRLLLGLLTSVFVLPTVVVGAAFVALLPEHLARSVWAILGAHVVFNLAVVVRVVGATWQHLPPDMEAAAATLGASPWQVFTRVVLPSIRPAVTAAASIVFVFTFTSFGVVRVLGGAGRATLEVEIWRRATQLGDVAGAAVLTVVQLVVLGVLVVWSTASQRRHGRALSLRPLADPRPPTTARERRLVAIVAGTTSAVVALPLVAMVERSFRGTGGYTTSAWRNLGATEVRPGIALGVDPGAALTATLQTMLWATLFAVVVGGVAALAIEAAGRRGSTLDAGLMLPLGTSAVTIGFGMLITFDAPPVDWRASWWLVPVGHALVAVPFVVRSTVGVLRGVDPHLRDAAATLGAGPVRAWRHVLVPHLWRPLAAGAGLAAAISLGEFGATSFLSRRGTETVPIVIERLLGRTGTLLQAQAFALSTILAAATVTVVLLLDSVGRTRRPRRAAP